MRTLEQVSTPSVDATSGTRVSSATSAEESTGEDFIVALSDRDTQRLESCLHPDVRLRALVPSGFQEQKGTAAVASRLKSWFAEAESIQVLEKDLHRVSDRLHIRYRFREHYSDGESELIEQDAYFGLREGTITNIDLLCSGHRPEKSPKAANAYRFDAGDMGCSSGLPEEFRRQIEGIPVGGILEVVTRDPSAKEDLPSLSRLLGHRVVSVTESPEGSTVLVVERGR